MLKPLTLSVSLAVALGACNLGVAGLHKSYASGQCPTPQCETPSAQCAPSPQSCAPRRHCNLLEWCKPKPKCYTYEWVLKKKRCGGGWFGHKACGSSACDSCGGVMPSAQWPTEQGYASPQAWGSGQAVIGGSYGAGQMAPAPAAAAPAPAGEEAPPAPSTTPAPEAAPPAPTTPPTPAPAAPGTASTSGGLLYLAPSGN